MKHTHIYVLDKAERHYRAETILRAYIMIIFYSAFFVLIADRIYQIFNFLYFTGPYLIGTNLPTFIQYFSTAFLPDLTGEIALEVYVTFATLLSISVIILSRSFKLSFLGLVITFYLTVGWNWHLFNSNKHSDLALYHLRDFLMYIILSVILILLYADHRIPNWKPQKHCLPLIPSPFWNISWLGLLSGSPLGLRRFNCKTKDKIVMAFMRGTDAARWGVNILVPILAITTAIVLPDKALQVLAASILAVVLYLIAYRFLDWLLPKFLSKQLIRPSISGRLRKYPTVLFLRSFSDDKGDFSSQDEANKLTSIGRLHSSLDAIILDELSAVGAVVAIGQPEQGLASYGASRVEASDEEWKKEFFKIGQEAVLIVFAVGTSLSLRWEMTQIRDRGWSEKTIFINPPTQIHADSGTMFLQEISQCFAESNIECALDKAPVALTFVGDDIYLATTTYLASDWSYVVALRHLADRIKLASKTK